MSAARVIDSLKFESPLSKLAVSGDGAQYLAVSTARLDSCNSIFIIGEQGFDAEDSLTRLVPSIFPPSTIVLNPTLATGRGAFTLAVAGEAIALWDDTEQLLAYCVPELFSNHSRYDVATGSYPGINETPVWSITHLDWSKHLPHSLLACHRSGQLCLYPIERLPSAQKTWLDYRIKTSTPTASLIQMAKNFASRVFYPAMGIPLGGESGDTSPTGTTRKSGTGARSSGPLYEVLAQPLVKSPTAAAIASSRFFSCARFLGSPSNLVAAKIGSTRLQLIDPRAKAESVAWDVALTGISKLCVEPSSSPTLILGLDKQCGVIHVFDSRKSERGELEAFARYTVSDLFDDNTLINDISWSENCPSQIFMSLQQKRAERSQWQPVAKMSSGVLRNTAHSSAKYISLSGDSTSLSYGWAQACSVATAVEALGPDRFAVTRMMGDVNHDGNDGDIVQVPPPPNASAPLRNMKFIANKTWHLSIAGFDKVAGSGINVFPI